MADALRPLRAAATNQYFRAAIEKNPGYKRAVALREKAIAAQRDFAPPHPLMSPLHSDDVIIPDFLDQAAAAESVERVRQAKLFALQELVRDCDRQIAGVMIQPDPLLASLAEDLDTLMEQVDAVVAQLRGAATAAEAITFGVAEKWKELAALRRTYDEIRDAQLAVMNGDDVGKDWIQMARSSYLTDHGIDDPLATDTALANVDEIWPSWRRPLSIDLSGQTVDGRPWPSDAVEQIAWLSSSAARAWVPTTSELSALQGERARRLNPSPGKPMRAEEGLLNESLPAHERVSPSYESVQG